MSNLLQDLLDLPSKGVIALISDSRKEVCVYQGSNVRMLLSRVLNEIKGNHHKYIEQPDSFRLEVLSGTVKDLTVRFIETMYWQDHYKNLGYKVLNYRNYIKLEPRLVYHRSGNLMVMLTTRRYESMVVGVFNKRDQADIFIQEVYGKDTNPYCFPVLANNNLTKQYIETLSNGIPKIRY